MATTYLLPPFSAIRMVWALTGSFSDNEQSKLLAASAEAELKDIKDQAKKESSKEEKRYIAIAVPTMFASLRSLETAYKGRQLNFEENEKLRSAYLESVTESINFGKKAQDFVKSLPTMTIGAAGGVTVFQAAGLSDDFSLWGAGLILAAIGYLINLWFVRIARGKKQMLYVTQDYERGLYYGQYVTRVSTILTSLYLDLDRVHRNVFGKPYPVDADMLPKIVDDILGGIRPTLCKYVHKHMKSKIITPELWSLCESGDEEAINWCKYWEGPKSK